MTLDRIVVIDTETTGLDEEKDEVLSLAIVDIDGNELFSSYIRPAERKRWPNAQKVNGITWAMVKDAPTLDQLASTLEPFFAEGRVIAGYNVGFDTKMLRASGLRIPSRAELDVMELYRSCYDLKRNTTLAKAAGRFRYKFDAHDSLEDARATAHVLRRLLDDNEIEAYIEEADRRIKEADRQAALRKKEAEEKRRQEVDAMIASDKRKERAWLIAFVAVLAIVIAVVALITAATAR